MSVAGHTPHLHVKSFFAATVKEALQRGHHDMGPDALLLQTREAPPEARHLGAFEVVLGLARQAAAPPAPEERPAAAGAIDEALVALKAFMRTLPAAARKTLVEGALIEAGLDTRMAHEIEEAVEQRLHRRPVLQMGRASSTRAGHAQSLASQTAAELASRFEVRPGIGRMTALVGPPGAGKTTTLVKLAVLEGMRARRPVRLISADTQRIGGAEQLRTFASILELPFAAVESIEALAAAMDAAAPNELVLIDTPGYGRALQKELGNELAAFLCSRQDLDTHLVLTASAHPAVLRRMIDDYRPYRPARLLFTRIDEIESLASVYCQAAREKIPLSYFGTGQSIPENLEAASSQKVTASLVRGLPEELQAVA